MKCVSYVKFQIVDTMELNTVTDVLCSKRTSPLYVGSIKSNIGHSEATSNFASLVKALIALDSGVIPPNLNYSSPNPDVPGLLSNKIKVNIFLSYFIL